ncbi:MAG: fatty acid desaturase [Caldilineaceae bacterium]|nr:fatty acid desaturase [Caldilineaceae bacterium]
MSVQAMPRDYSLTGVTERAVPLDDFDIESRMDGVWWKPTLPRQEMRAFMERTDGPALVHFGLWFVLLAASAAWAVSAWGTWWAIPAFLIYGTIYSSSDARWHECGHGTPFRTQWLNELFYHISSFLTLREAYMWRWSHSRHHTDTYFVGLDPEIQVQRPADLLKIVMDFLYLRSGPPEVWRVVRNAFGRPGPDVRHFVPESERNKMYWSSRVYVAIIVGFAIWSIAIWSFLPMMFVLLPRFYGGWLHQLLGLTQHAGLGEDTHDHRENTRTVFVNPVYRYLYMNMNYHIEHHSVPMVPYHALGRFHEAVKDQMPPAYPNLWAVYKEMIPALIKQATEDASYQIMRPIPTEQGKSAEVESVAAATADSEWIEVCPVGALEENDVVRVDHGGRFFAVCRLEGDAYHATDGLCTHEYADLTDGIVFDGVIECPLHNGRFDIVSGDAVRSPACGSLQTYPVEVRGDSIFLRVRA